MSMSPSHGSDELLSLPGLPGSHLKLTRGNSLNITGTRMVSDVFAVSLQMPLPYQQDVRGAGSLSGAGTLATVWQLSPTVFAQYRLGEAQSTWRPYAGLGLACSFFMDETGSNALTAITAPGSSSATTLSLESGCGLATQLGLNWRLAPRWFVDVSLSRTGLKSTLTLSTGQTQKVQLDPSVFNLSVGWRY